jgi:hypothetical protein
MSASKNAMTYSDSPPTPEDVLDVPILLALDATPFFLHALNAPPDNTSKKETVSLTVELDGISTEILAIHAYQHARLAPTEPLALIATMPFS